MKKKTSARGTQETTAPQEPLRLPTVAANLLPMEIVDYRRMRRIRRMVLMTLVPFLLLLGGWYALAAHQAAQAERSVAQVNEDVRRLQEQQKAFSEVTRAQAESAEINGRLAKLFVGDLSWPNLLTPLQRVAPPGVQLTSVSARRSIGPEQTAGQLPNGSGQPLVGSLTVTGSAPNQTVVAQYVDALGTVPGLANPMLGDAVAAENGLQFTVRLDITAAALSGRYSKDTNGSKP